MQNLDINQTLNSWRPLSAMVYVPHNHAEHERLVSVLDDLVDEVGEDESHPLASLMEIVGVLIEKYEDENAPELTADSTKEGLQP